jgi:hypothetical protein
MRCTTLPSYFCAISFRCHANKVSGETIVAMSAKHFRPDCFALATALAIRIANGVEAIGEELAIEIRDRVNSENAETGMRVPIPQVVGACLKGKKARIRENRRVAQHAGRLCESRNRRRDGA